MAPRTQLLIGIIAAALVVVASPIYSKKQGQTKIKYMNDGMGPVTINFDKHKKAGIRCADCHHPENTDGNRCTGCHHRDDATNQACSNCHKKKEQLKRPERNIIYHTGMKADGHGGVRHRRFTCSGCHQIYKKKGLKHGPVYRSDGEGCDGCHK